MTTNESPHRPLTAIVMTTVAVLIAVTGVLLAGPASHVTTQPNPVHPGDMAAPTGEVTRVDVRIEGLSFVPNRIEVPAGNSVELHVTNSSEQGHDLVFDGPQGPGTLTTGRIQPGQSATVTVPALVAPTEGWCSLPGHRAAGMTLKLQPSAVNSPTPATPNHDGGHNHHHHGHAEGPTSSHGSFPLPSMDALTDYAKTEKPHPAELPAVTTPAGTEHRITLRATETTQKLADGSERTLWTFNGMSPAPTLRGKVGDIFRITLINDGTMGHSIDFHAGDVSPDAPMRTIEPGESLEYVFTARRAGIWMYHCGTPPMSLHIAAGMHGAVVIDPPNLEPVDKEFAFVAAEVYPDDSNGIATTSRISKLQPDLLAFNGRPHQYVAHPLKARVGETIRMWVLNAGPNASTAFHVVGTQFDTVWNEGAYTLKNGAQPGAAGETNTRGHGGSQVLPLLAAQGGFVEFTPTEPGTYTFVNHIMSFAEQGQRGQLIVEP